MRTNIHSKWIFFSDNLVFQILRSLVSITKFWDSLLIPFLVLCNTFTTFQLMLILVKDTEIHQLFSKSHRPVKLLKLLLTRRFAVFRY